MPNVGKSTLFKELTKKEVNIANYPFCTIEPNVGIVTVPDERVDKLTKFSASAKTIPAVIEFYDIAGLVKGANTGEGLGNQFLTHIKETQAMVMVLRCFGGEEIIHVENSVDPVRDMDIINTELALKDLESIEKAGKRFEADAKKGDKESIKALDGLKVLRPILEKGASISGKEHSNILQNVRMLELNLLTAKKQVYFLNGKPSDVSDALKQKIKEVGADYVVADLSVPSVDLTPLIRKAYEILNLISFFTTGADETRAWTIEKGYKAPQAAGAIHTDFEKKFIRAEVINWQKLIEAGSWSQAKAKGWVRLEGKDYVFQDGDVTEIRHG